MCNRIAAQLGFADRDALVAAHDADALSRLRREYWLACMERGTIPELRARRSPEWISANLERAVPPWYRSSTPLPRMCQGLGALTGTEAAAYEERWY